MPNLTIDPGQLGLGAFATIGSIILIDIALSSDNALVIGAAASRLPRAQRILALIWGGLGAIILRVVLAGAATLLLLIPLLRAIGGVILMFIAARLLLPDDETHVNASNRFLPAMLTIIVADVTMSLDNIIAVGALAKGDVVLLGIGLLGSMVVLFLASALVARIIERLSILLDLASVVLAFTAANLIIGDPWVGPYVHSLGFASFSGDIVLQVGFVALILLVDAALRLRRWWASRDAVKAAEGASVTVGASTQAWNALPGTQTQQDALSLNGSAGANGHAAGSLPSGNGASPLREPVASHPLGGPVDRAEEGDRAAR